MTIPLRLHVVPPHGEPYDQPFDRDEIVIGRASDADLPLADRFLSRHHARLYRRDAELFVEDMGSRNGTLVNGSPIDAPTEVGPGDVIKMCGSTVSLVAAGEKPPPVPSPDDELSGVTVYRDATQFLHNSSQVAALGDERALRRYAERLQLLNEVHHALGRSMELDELLELILDGAFKHLRPEEGAILLRQADGEMGLAASRSPSGSQLLYSRSLVREVTEKGVAALVYDAQMDERFAAAQSILTSGVRSLCAAPLLDDRESLGMIVVGSRVAVRAFNEEDLELLVSLASVAALRLRNVKLAEEAAQRRILEQELTLARHIQTALLPSSLPHFDGYTLHGGTLPSRTVSGDIYQMVDRDGDCVILVADVSGKGIAASLLTASLEALTAGPIEVGHPPAEIFNRVNERLFRRTPPEKYATGFLAILAPPEGRVTYTNAGHNPALLVRRDGQAEELGATGTPLGLLAGVAFTERRTELRPGDTLYIYTDGVTEAVNAEDEEYSMERLVACLRDHRRAPLHEMVRAVEEDLKEFIGEIPFADDVTVVAVRREDAGGPPPSRSKAVKRAGAKRKPRRPRPA